MSFARRTARVVISVFAVATLAGCGSSPHNNAEPALGTIAKVTEQSQVSRPITAYLPSVQQATALGQLQLQITNQCLSENGFQGSFTVSGGGFEAFARGSQIDSVVRSPLWGFFGTDTAATYGYQRPPDQVGMLSLVPPQGISDELSNKCTQKSLSAMGGGMWSEFLYPSNLPNGGPSVPLTDSRWVAVVSKWTACMKAQGFDYDNPLSAVFNVSWANQPVNATQIATATADIQCKLSTNMVGIGAALQAAYDQRYIDSHRSELSAFQDKIESLIRGSK